MGDENLLAPRIPEPRQFAFGEDVGEECRTVGRFDAFQYHARHRPFGAYRPSADGIGDDARAVVGCR